MSLVEFTDYLVKGLVSDPDSVKVDVLDAEEDTKILEIVVADKEMKYLIGRNGKNAKAIRTMVNAFAYIHGMKRVTVNIDAY